MPFDWAGWMSKLKDIEFQLIQHSEDLSISARVIVTDVLFDSQDENSLSALQNEAKDRGLFVFLDPRHPKVPLVVGELWYVTAMK